MSTSAISTAISSSVRGLRLLDHPYYRAWEEGQLRKSDLKSYAEQYRHFEQCLPEVLHDVADQMDPGSPRRLVEANLEDELTNPRPHMELFLDFEKAVGVAAEAAPTRAASELVGLYRDAARLGAGPLLSVVAAYEVQAAEIAATKAAALALHYDVDPSGTAFWSVHAEVERRHSTWTVAALEGMGAGEDEVGRWARRSARAWWRFLDEREAFRAA